MKLTFPMPLPRLFDDPGRCAKVAPGLLRAWVVARVVVSEAEGPRLMVGPREDLRSIAEPQCYPEALSLVADLWCRVRYCELGMDVLGPRVPGHRPGRCRYCGFYADAAPAPPRDDATTVEVVLVGRVRRRGECCWGSQQTLHGVWLAGLCGRPQHIEHENNPGIMVHDEPAVFVGGFDWVDGRGRAGAVSLCRACAEDWRHGTVFDADELARRFGVPVRWAR